MDIGKLLDDEVRATVPFEDAEVEIRYVSRKEILQIIKTATKIRFNSKHQKEEDIDSEISNRLMGAAAVVGWNGFTKGGEEYPFTPENRDALMDTWGEFCTFVNNICTDLTALVEAGREDGRKNL